MCWVRTKPGHLNHYYLVIFPIVGYLAVLTFCPLIQAAFAIEYTNHTSKLLGISYKYPDNWSVNETTEYGTDQITVSGPDIFEDGTFLIKESRIPTIELDMVLQDPKSKYSYLYFNYESMQSISDTKASIIKEPYSLLIGPYKGESMIFKQGAFDTTQQDWFVSLPDERSYVITFVSRPDRFDSPEAIDIRNAFISSIKFLNPS
jgi:hypothetical protein